MKDHSALKIKAYHFLLTETSVLVARIMICIEGLFQMLSSKHFQLV